LAPTNQVGMLAVVHGVVLLPLVNMLLRMLLRMQAGVAVVRQGLAEAPLAASVCMSECCWWWWRRAR
jgi:hypothetical protein